MTVTAPVAKLFSRVEAFEADCETLYGSVQMLGGECRDTNRRQRADRKLMVAMRTTQIEHGAKLDSLLVGQERLEHSQEKLQRSQDRLLDSYVHLERDVADMKKTQARLAEDVSGLKDGQARLAEDVSGLKTDVSGLKADVSELKTDVSGLKADVSGLKDGQARLEDKFDRLERLVRKGFGMDS